MDMLFLEGLEVPCRVGCTDPERATPQSLRVEVRLYCPSLRDAALADDLERTVDYRLAGDLVSFVAQQVGGKGGGKADMAMAGGSDPSRLGEALASVPKWVEERV